MTREEAKSFIIDISYDLGNIDVEYLTEKDGKKMREAVEVLEQEPCEDCVSREEVHNLIIPWLNDYLLDETREALETIDYKIEDLQPVTPQSKTGHWINIMVGDMPAQACDQCKTFYPLAYTGGGHRFCPNCGAKMVEPQESDG